MNMNYLCSQYWPRSSLLKLFKDLCPTLYIHSNFLSCPLTGSCGSSTANQKAAQKNCYLEPARMKIPAFLLLGPKPKWGKWCFKWKLKGLVCLFIFTLPPSSSYTSEMNLSNGHNYKNSPQLFKCSFSNLKKFHINLRITSKMEKSVDNHSPKLPGIFPVSFNQKQISYRTDTASALLLQLGWIGRAYQKRFRQLFLPR